MRALLSILPLVFVRPGELRKAEWSEIDLNKAEWNIPAEKMKMSQSHLVPLSKQVVEILSKLRSFTGGESTFFLPRSKQVVACQKIFLITRLEG